MPDQRQTGSPSVDSISQSLGALRFSGLLLLLIPSGVIQCPFLEHHRFPTARGKGQGDVPGLHGPAFPLASLYPRIPLLSELHRPNTLPVHSLYHGISASVASIA